MEQGNDIPSVIEEVFKRYTDGSYIKASMLPDLDLYVDQILPKPSVLKMTRS